MSHAIFARTKQENLDVGESDPEGKLGSFLADDLGLEGGGEDRFDLGTGVVENKRLDKGRENDLREEHDG